LSEKLNVAEDAGVLLWSFFHCLASDALGRSVRAMNINSAFVPFIGLLGLVIAAISLGVMIDRKR
jgi:hypothetical protein